MEMDVCVLYSRLSSFLFCHSLSKCVSRCFFFAYFHTITQRFLPYCLLYYYIAIYTQVAPILSFK